MKISSKTKISELIKFSPKAIDAIASINKHFEKLKNPLLRKILASRVTIADAAKIGGSSAALFFEKLQPLGFETEEYNNFKNNNHMTTLSTKPAFMNDINAANTTILDVRQDIASGNDPFQKIMKTIAEMPSENTLLIINTFEPIPLISILKKKGYESFVEHPEKGVVHSYLKKTGAASIPSLTEKQKNDVEDFDAKKAEYAENLVHVDVRDLEMPLPMVTILSELDKLHCNQALFVHHKKVPQYLLPELKDRGLGWIFKEVGEGDVKMLIFKVGC